MNHNMIESFSIIIPTHNRCSKLNALLKSIEEHKVIQVKEIIIIDDSGVHCSIETTGKIRIIHVKISFRVFISHAKTSELSSHHQISFFLLTMIILLVRKRFNQ